jgi:aminopeptidase C
MSENQKKVALSNNLFFKKKYEKTNYFLVILTILLPASLVIFNK